MSLANTIMFKSMVMGGKRHFRVSILSIGGANLIYHGSCGIWMRLNLNIVFWL